MADEPKQDSSAAVDAFLATLEHPFKPEIKALRHLVLGADPAIAEGIKWKAPSYRTHEYFATTHLRTKTGIALILHLGAKVRADAEMATAIADPEGLLQWLARDRAMVCFADMAEIERRRAAFQALIRAWIRHV